MPTLKLVSKIRVKSKKVNRKASQKVIKNKLVIKKKVKVIPKTNNILKRSKSKTTQEVITPSNITIDIPIKEEQEKLDEQKLESKSEQKLKLKPNIKKHVIKLRNKPAARQEEKIIKWDEKILEIDNKQAKNRIGTRVENSDMPTKTINISSKPESWKNVNEIVNIRDDDRDIEEIFDKSVPIQLDDDCAKLLIEMTSGKNLDKDEIIIDVQHQRSIAKRRLLNAKWKRKKCEIDIYSHKVKVCDRILSDLKQKIIKKRYTCVDNKRHNQNSKFKKIKIMSEDNYIKKIDISMTNSEKNVLKKNGKFYEINEKIRQSGKEFSGFGRRFKGENGDQHGDTTDRRSQRLVKFENRIRASKMPREIQESLENKRTDALTRNIIINYHPELTKYRKYDPFSSQYGIVNQPLSQSNVKTTSGFDPNW